MFDKQQDCLQGLAPSLPERHPYTGGPQTYAAYLANTDGYEVELTTSNP